eukprot:5062291-Prymnesium_polylepis.1
MARTAASFSLVVSSCQFATLESEPSLPMTIGPSASSLVCISWAAQHRTAQRSASARRPFMMWMRTQLLAQHGGGGWRRPDR